MIMDEPYDPKPPLPGLAEVHGWTEERRKKHAESIKRWKPWNKSTGPRSAAGKARSSKNALKHGQRSAEMRLLRSLIASQKRLHTLAARAAREKHQKRANELLDDGGLDGLDAVIKASAQAIAGYARLIFPKIMQKPCNSDPPEAKS